MTKQAFQIVLKTAQELLDTENCTGLVSENGEISVEYIFDDGAYAYFYVTIETKLFVEDYTFRYNLKDTTDYDLFVRDLSVE